MQKAKEPLFLLGWGEGRSFIPANRVEPWEGGDIVTEETCLPASLKAI
jgi:hypothetical protein